LVSVICIRDALLQFAVGCRFSHPVANFCSVAYLFSLGPTTTEHELIFSIWKIFVSLFSDQQQDCYVIITDFQGLMQHVGVCIQILGLSFVFNYLLYSSHPLPWIIESSLYIIKLQNWLWPSFRYAAGELYILYSAHYFVRVSLAFELCSFRFIIWFNKVR
jgi:hypothetical protein